MDLTTRERIAIARLQTATPERLPDHKTCRAWMEMLIESAIYDALEAAGMFGPADPGGAEGAEGGEPS